MKNEGGLTIKRLSHKKLLFVYTVPIFLGDFADVVVGYMPLKVRYRASSEPFSESGTYQICDQTKLYRGISQKWGIKVKQIGTDAKQKMVKIDGKDILFDRVVNYFYFADPVWIRDHQLKNILNETG